ncbi:uncharacterized protein LOC104901350 [Beta vulgaris subsp. vulgaris]|uniref:uncharacterized protein LOC104901350 n=1 Tax=Beta vulgaris subsp. vulgaris TaxID=3555 RepID=UPI00053FE978|nr:uncharacterized protein LOC104901350 [Beta vulgaris subsp. vulgaris]
MQASKLRWIALNQDKIRADLYKSLEDSLSPGEHNTEKVGRRTIPPSSFVGSPRDMHQRYQDVIALVQKFELKKDVLERGILAKVVAYVYVVEFQKRGIPHVHMLLILKQTDKLTTPDDYDIIVRAEIPDERREPELYKKVLKHMIQGPCGVHNRDCPCMKQGSCKKGFPKSFTNATIQQGNDSYPLYCRRQDRPPVPLRENSRIEVNNR